MKKKFFSFLKEPFSKIVLQKKRENFFLFLGIIVSNLVSALSEGFSFGLIIAAITRLEHGAAVQKSFAFLGNWHFSNKKVVFIFLGLAVFFQALRSAFSYLGQIWAVFFSTKVQEEMQKKIFSQILRFSFPYVNKYKVGDLVEYATSPLSSVPGFINASYIILVSFFTSIILFLWMFKISRSLTLIVFIGTAVLSFVQKYVAQKVTALSKKFSESLVSFTKTAIQSLYALRLIHTFHYQKKTFEDAKINIENISLITRKENIYRNFITPLNEILSVVLLSVCVVYGQMSSSISFPTLLTFITITYRLSTRMQLLNQSIIMVASSMGYIFRVNTILKDEGKEFLEDTGKEFEKLKEEIFFDNISLLYAKNNRKALDSISFSIKKGQRVAFVGPSGAGKSSILDMLLRLHKPTNGTIWVDNKNYEKYNLKSWRKIFGVVSQDTFLFNDTIEKNIQFGSDNKNFRSTILAAKQANAYDFIMQLPEKFQTVIGEQGYCLSGGEKQRIALARAFLRDFEILVLDEATSNLDSYSEKLIFDAVDSFSKNKTVIIVAHRLSTIQNADQIFFVEQGQVIEKGNHHQLLEKKGKYSFFWQLQSSQKNKDSYLVNI